MSPNESRLLLPMHQRHCFPPPPPQMALSDSKYTVTELTRSKGAMEASFAPMSRMAFLHRSSLYLLTGYFYL